MDSYINRLFQEEISGIPLSAWQRFLSIFSENWSEENVTHILDQIALQHSKKEPELSPDAISRI